MKSLMALCAVVAATGCWEDDRPIVWDRQRTVLGPIPMKDQVAYVDSALDRVTLLDLSRDTTRITTTGIGRRAVVAVPSPDRHLLFVITRGEEAIHEGQIDQPPMFWVVDTVDKSRPQLAYEIGSPPSAVGFLPDAAQTFVAQRHPLGRVSFVGLETDAMRTVTGFDLNSDIVE